MFVVLLVSGWVNNYKLNLQEKEEGKEKKSFFLETGESSVDNKEWNTHLFQAYVPQVRAASYTNTAKKH